MHIKHLKFGKGSCKKASDYLLQQNDSTGKKRDEIIVLRGNPEQVAAVADSLNFKYKYTSGVIAFSPDDNPTPGQIKNVLDDYEKIAFSGLDPDQYSFSAVLHREKDKGIHIHTLTARVELTTGKSMNIAPPGHLKTFDAVRDYHNYKNNWTRPDDPERARLLQPNFHAYIDAKKLRQGMKVEPDTREFINTYLEQRVDIGKINNRQDVLDSLHSVGLKTPRIGKKYITVLDTDTNKRFRMKGVLYNENFKRDDLKREIESTNGRGQTRDRTADKTAARDAYNEFERLCKKRAEFNQERYKIQSRRHDRRLKKDANNHEKNEQEKSPERAEKNFCSSLHLDSYINQQLGSDAISAKTLDYDSYASRADSDRKKSKDLGNNFEQKQERKIYHFTTFFDSEDRVSGGEQKSPQIDSEIKCIREEIRKKEREREREQEKEREREQEQKQEPEPQPAAQAQEQEREQKPEPTTPQPQAEPQQEQKQDDRQDFRDIAADTEQPQQQEQENENEYYRMR